MDNTVSCEYCGLCQEQPDTSPTPGHQIGALTDFGWMCDDCLMRGRRRTKAQMEWQWFAEEYPQFALELKRLRKQASQ